MHVSSAQLMERCRAVGLKVTPQRLAIFGELSARTDHPSPEAVFRAVSGDMPTLSLATVYKTLDALEAAGLIRQVARLGETKRYDANLSPHHHLICSTCDRIIDFEEPTLSALPALPGGVGFSAREVQVQIFGCCEDCESAPGADGAR